ncbi:MAG: Crp/Fnr family transcriptional regulator [Actinobacteria bacterium]|nr:MAG: Crp/Fnr family transcriptional regulator [Actinomycetota bacterium]
MTVTDAIAGLPRRRLGVGDEVLGVQLADAAFVFVDEGLVVLRNAANGVRRRTITCHAGSGSLILPPQPGEVLVALTDAALVVMSRADLEVVLAIPAKAAALVEGLTATLRQKHAAIANMSRLHHVDRVREKLIELAQEHGRVGRDGIRLDFPLTHDLLGEMTGSARETVTRALDELQRDGFVERNGRTYRLHVAPEDLGVTARTLRH